MNNLFLSSKWQSLVLINYEIDPSVLIPFIPKGTQLDLWDGKAFVSIVGLMFYDTTVKGIPIPFHRNFEEVNLRFYVKNCQHPEGVRRGVVFIKEIVPRWGIAFLARLLYNENYTSLPMEHIIEAQTVEYRWKFQEKWQRIRVGFEGDPYYPLQGSQAEFIAEHYWGYCSQTNGETLEYHVKHTPWRIWEPNQCEVEVDMKNIYGQPFAPFLEKPPASVLLAEGSDVQVFKGKKL